MKAKANIMADDKTKNSPTVATDVDTKKVQTAGRDFDGDVTGTKIMDLKGNKYVKTDYDKTQNKLQSKFDPEARKNLDRDFDGDPNVTQLHPDYIASEEQKASIKKAEKMQHDVHQMVEDAMDNMPKDRDRLHQNALNGKTQIEPFKNLKKAITYDDVLEKQNNHGLLIGDVSPDGLFIDSRVRRGSNNGEPMHITEDGHVYQFGDKKFFQKFMKEAQGQFENGYMPVYINSQGLIPIESIDKKTGRTNWKFVAGPEGATLAGHEMKPGEATGNYNLDPKAETELYNDFAFDEMGPMNGATTYVDPKSELIASNHIPRNTVLVKSKLDTRETEPTSHLNKLDLYNSNLNIAGKSWLDDVHATNTKTLNDAEVHVTKSAMRDSYLRNGARIKGSKLQNTSIGMSNIENSNIIGGSIAGGSKVKDSIIKQNAKSLIAESNLNKAAIVNDDLKPEDLIKADPDAATTMDGAVIDNSVLHGTNKNPVVLANTRMANSYVLNGLTSRNSKLMARMARPMILRGVIADNNNVKPEKFITKLVGNLPTGKTIDDAEIVRHNLPAVMPNTRAAKALREYGNGRFLNRSLNEVSKNVANAFMPENQMTGPQKRALLIQVHPELADDESIRDAALADKRARADAKLHVVHDKNSKDKSKEQDPTDDL